MIRVFQDSLQDQAASAESVNETPADVLWNARPRAFEIRSGVSVRQDTGQLCVIY